STSEAVMFRGCIVSEVETLQTIHCFSIWRPQRLKSYSESSLFQNY
ncbi:hypothetical protein A2U01_0112617, partial [Trifolium medium]|nr:hypothetical protein [Trifolium medium]